MFTPEEEQRIKEKLAWFAGEMYQSNGWKQDNDRNWRKALNIFDIEMKCNEENWLRKLL